MNLAISSSALRIALAMAALIGSIALAAPTAANAACAESTTKLNPATGKLELNLGNCVGDNEAWAREYDSSVSQATFYPDLSANYWITSLPSISGQNAHWEIRGSMPDARFSSVQAYTLTGDTMGAVFDEQIAPKAGSVNWINDSGFYPGAASVKYTIPVVQTSATAPLPASTLRVDDAKLQGALGGAASFAYRVYPNTRPGSSAPPAGVSQREWIARGQVDLPEIVYVVDDPAQGYIKSIDEVIQSRQLLPRVITTALAGVEAIGDAISPILEAFPQATDKLWDDPVNWEANAGLATNLRQMFNAQRAPLAAAAWKAATNQIGNFSAFPNEASRYYVGGVNAGLGQVLVTRFKAPTTPEPDRGEPMRASNASSKQLRYWSACMNNTLTLYVTGCVKDSQAVVAPDGYVTIVASSTSSAPRGMSGQPAANWLRHGSPNQLLLIRQTLASPAFTQSILNYRGAADDTTAVAAHSGPYYPVSTYCSLANFRYNDCRWRFSATQEWLYALSPSTFAARFPR